MTETASQRAPVEIWIQILELAIKTRLHCYENKNMVEDMELFEVNCSSYEVFSRSENDRSNFRLICKSWNAILKDKSDRLIITDLHYFNAPSSQLNKTARRIEVVKSIACDCDKRACPLKERDETRQDDDWPVWPRQWPGFDGLEALLCRVYANPPELLNCTHTVKLFQWSFGPSTRDPGPLKSNRFPNLTMLRLSNITHYLIKCASNEIHFPRLRFLWISFCLSRREVKAGVIPATLAGCKLPKLERVNVSGICQSDLWDEILAMLVSCREALKQIRISVDPLYGNDEKDYWKLMQSIWSTFPNLTHFGVPLKFYNRSFELDDILPTENSLVLLFSEVPSSRCASKCSSSAVVAKAQAIGANIQLSS